MIKNKVCVKKSLLSELTQKINIPIFAALSFFAYDARAYEEIHDVGSNLMDHWGFGDPPRARISADGKVLITYVLDASGGAMFVVRRENGQIESPLTASGGNIYSVNALSANGEVIAGTIKNGYGGDVEAFKYVNGKITTLGVLNIRSNVVGVSADGNVIVGGSFNSQGRVQGYKYTDKDGMQAISFGGNTSRVTGVSADGNVVIGQGHDGNLRYVAFRHTDGDGIKELGIPAGAYSSEARAVSANGTVIVGSVTLAISSNDRRAFKYTDATDRIEYLDKDNDRFGISSWANLVSANGVVTVGGWYDSDYNVKAYKHTDTGGMVDLGSLGGWDTAAAAVSADGSIIVGWSLDLNDVLHAFRYTDETGMLILSSLGGDTRATGISADGKIIIGTSQTVTGLSHVVLWKEKKMLDQTNTLKSLSDAASRGWNVLDMRSAQLQALIQQDCQISTGSYCIGAGGSYTNSRGVHETAANLVLGKQLSSQWRIGASLNQGMDTSLPSGYKASNHMPGVGVFAQFNARKDGLGWRGRVGAAYQQSKVMITRDQLAFTEAGSGRADIKGKAASAEGSYRFALKDGVMLEPYAALRYSNVSRSAYSETNDIEFAGSYAAMGREATSIAAGLRVGRQVNDKLGLSMDLGMTGDVAVDNRDFQVAMDYVGNFNRGSGRDDRTRVHLGVQGMYALSADSGINAGISWSQQPYGNNATNAQIMYVRQF